MTESANSEENLFKKSFPKLFKPTIENLENLISDGDYQIIISYTDRKSNKKAETFNATLSSDEGAGIKFKITLPNRLEIDSAYSKETYGLSEELTLSNGQETYIIPRDSVNNFNTNYPSIPQFLEGHCTHIHSHIEPSSPSYCRIAIPINETAMLFPASILDYDEVHLKYDVPEWDDLISIMGRFTELEIKEKTFHFYGVRQFKKLIIDSIDTITIEEFKKIAYSIRLCFGFISGKFYRGEVFYLTSNKSDFSTISFAEYQVEEPSILTDNQIINPSFFFKQIEREKRIEWEEFHNHLSTKVFSTMCEKILDSPEFARTLELIINAGNISDPIQKGALYSVSLETFTKLFQSENKETFKPIPKSNNDLWKGLRKKFEISLENIKEQIDENGYTILSKKIENLNSPTTREQLEKPFRLVGINLSGSEIDYLKQRNDYLHGGQPNDDNWIIKTNINALKMHSLLGKLILKYFNYSGHYIDICAWNLLNVREINERRDKFDIHEVKDLFSKIEKGDFDAPDQIKEAKRALNKLNKFWDIVSEIKGLITII